jgi:ribosomal protein L34
MLMAWERWQQLPPEQKERYKRQARQAADQGKKVLGQRRKRG